MRASLDSSLLLILANALTVQTQAQSCPDIHIFGVTVLAQYTGGQGTLRAELDLLLRIGAAGRSGSINKT
ncbi:unnamed protein product [Fusarium graminearum]|uniref:Uncharacterized protein n=1 Tax=Gibberella zeae TaxID=5518 RepID=A0A4U9F447_GIBZA|nr:unnamed protein product [Fusarium graminearum]CZS79421.1 unnamed protein product [Fusarium graminearum]VTO90864.1 unnamed protein product [Fusarium graminearum]